MLGSRGNSISIFVIVSVLLTSSFIPYLTQEAYADVTAVTASANFSTVPSTITLTFSGGDATDITALPNTAITINDSFGSSYTLTGGTNDVGDPGLVVTVRQSVIDRNALKNTLAQSGLYTVDVAGGPLTTDNTAHAATLNSAAFTPTFSSTGGGSDTFKTRPTFGLDHNTFKPWINGGFSFNGVSHDITDNYWTPFNEQQVKVGTTNTFSAKVYADKGLRTQEFLFGIPEVGKAQDAEVSIEVSYDHQQNIIDTKVNQKTNVVNVDSLIASHSVINCSSEYNFQCDVTKISIKFLEPLKDKVMVIKAIDHKRQVQFTYLNEGFDITGNSLNPMNTKMIPGPEKYEGLVEVTQTTKYSDIWVSNDGIEFNMSKSGEFTQINQSFEHPINSGMINNRLHSDFVDYKETQADLASDIMSGYYRATINYDESFLEINDVFAYQYPETISKLSDSEILQNMKIQEEKAQKIMEQLLDPSNGKSANSNR